MATIGPRKIIIEMGNAIFDDWLLREIAVIIRVLVSVAKARSCLWRKPCRRGAERKRFSALMRKVEAIRLRYRMRKTELAAELKTTTDALRNWTTGRTVGRKETVAKIEAFLDRAERLRSGRAR